MRCRTHFTAILLREAIGVSGAAGAIAPQKMPGPTRADASAVLHAERVPLGTLARDMFALATAVSAIEDDLQAGLAEASAAQDPSPLLARVPGLRAQIAALQEVTSRMAGYRVGNGSFERRRLGMVKEAPAYAAVVTRLLDAIEAQDGGALVAALEQYPVRAIALVRAAQGTPNAPAARYRRDARALTGSLTRMNRIVRRPTKAGMARGRAVFVRERRTFDRRIRVMRGYRLAGEGLEAERAETVKRARVIRTALNRAIAHSRSKKAVPAGLALQRAITRYRLAVARACEGAKADAGSGPRALEERRTAMTDAPRSSPRSAGSRPEGSDSGAAGPLTRSRDAPGAGRRSGPGARQTRADVAGLDERIARRLGFGGRARRTREAASARRFTGAEGGRTGRPTSAIVRHRARASGTS